MTAQRIERSKLGALTKIGQGGQGVVHGAPNVKTKFAASMVYKEYKAQTLAEIDFAALAAMPALVEDSLSYAEAERLISIAAWPCAIVEDGGRPTGFVMPAIPDEFFVSLSTAKGVSSTTAEFQHLLNHPTVLEARGIDIDDAQRYTLLREASSALAFMHKHGVCVGDISPKNLLFSLTPREAIYFIDCDAIRINGVSALRQVETPGWDAPSGEELATIYTDTYKLGLLALRLLAGDQDTKNPGHLPATTPTMLRQIITDTLTNQAHQRPLPEAWTYVLGNAIELAQHQQKSTPPVSTPLAPPEIPVLHSRPTPHSIPPTHPSAPPPSAPVWVTPASRPTSSKAPIWAGVGVAALVVAVIIVAVGAVANSEHNPPSSAPETSSTQELTPTQQSTYAYGPAPTSTPALDPETAAYQQLQALKDEDAPAIAQVLDRWIPQLSSKRSTEPWTYDREDGVTYDSQMILQEHQRLRQQYGAKLIWAGDYTTFDGPDFWVTVVPIPFPGAGGALNWCRRNGLDNDHCDAQILSKTLGPNGTHAHNN